VARFDLRGTLVWGRLLDGPMTATYPSLAVAGSSVYVAANDAHGEVALTKLTTDGARAWSHTWPKASQYIEPKIAANADGSVFVFASHSETTVASPTSSSLSKLDAAGTELWSLPLESPWASAVAIDPSGTAYAYGSSSSNAGALLTKVDAAGKPVWTHEWKTDETSTVTSVSALSLDGNDLVLGVGYGGQDARLELCRLSTAGGNVLWTRAFTSPRGSMNVSSLLTMADGSIVLGGGMMGAVDLDPGPGVDERHTADTDAFVVRLDHDSNYRAGRVWGGPEARDRVFGIATLATGSLVVAGSYEAKVDFALGAENDVRASRGHDDTFLTMFPADFRSETRSERRPAPVCSAPDPAFPKDYAECVARFGSGGPSIEGRGLCIANYSEGDPDFDKCKTLGGGLTVAEGSTPMYSCKIDYYEDKCACLGNFCD
jgi:outer membrane protein assembly factor BamB